VFDRIVHRDACMTGYEKVYHGTGRSFSYC